MEPSLTRPVTFHVEAMFTTAVPEAAYSTVRLTVAVWFSPPDTPVMVIVDVPALAKALAASLRMRVPAVGLLLSWPVTPLGMPETFSVTLLAKPFNGVNVRVLLPVAPMAMLRAVGEADNVKFGAGAMASAIVTLLVRLPEVPVMVTVEELAAALLAAAKVTVLRLAVLAGEKLAVTPAGRPDAASATVPLKPLRALTAIVLAPLVPGFRLTLPGVADRLKLGGGLTVSTSEPWPVRLPEVPVMITVVEIAAAVLAAVNVTVLWFAVLAGEKLAVTPAGSS